MSHVQEIIEEEKLNKEELNHKRSRLLEVVDAEQILQSNFQEN